MLWAVLSRSPNILYLTLKTRAYTSSNLHRPLKTEPNSRVNCFGNAVGSERNFSGETNVIRAKKKDYPVDCNTHLLNLPIATSGKAWANVLYAGGVSESVPPIRALKGRYL